ncbi:hypothetical protein BKA80DRAFT_66684 [Phyllosticta citrichinensis]
MGSRQMGMIGGPRTLNCSCTPPRTLHLSHTRTEGRGGCARALENSLAFSRTRGGRGGRANGRRRCSRSGTCCTRIVARFSMAVEIPPALIKHAILEAILNLNLDVKDESGHSFFDFFCSLLYQCTEASATTAASSAEELAIELWNRFPRRHKSSSPWTHPPLLNFTLLALYRRRAAWYGWYKPIEEAAMSKWLAHVGHSMPLCVGSCPICEAYSRIHGGVL